MRERFILHSLVHLLHTLNHTSMKTDVLNLKGNKRSGKLTTDEKTGCVQRFLHINLLCFLLSPSERNGLGSKGSNTGKEQGRKERVK